MMQGRYRAARAWAAQLRRCVAGHIDAKPMIAAYGADEWFVLVRFGQWDEMLRRDIPADAVAMLNPAPQIPELARIGLQAPIAQARHATLDEFRHWQEAVPREDALGSMEPPDWFFSNPRRSGACSSTRCQGRRGQTHLSPGSRRESAQCTIAARSETSVTVAGQKRKPRVR